ncbi:hypothetical protein KCU76_g1, partial [Aureobasidium melanogenum]
MSMCLREKVANMAFVLCRRGGIVVFSSVLYIGSLLQARFTRSTDILTKPPRSSGLKDEGWLCERLMRNCAFTPHTLVLGETCPGQPVITLPGSYHAERYGNCTGMCTCATKQGSAVQQGEVAMEGFAHGSEACINARLRKHASCSEMTTAHVGHQHRRRFIEFQLASLHSLQLLVVGSHTRYMHISTCDPDSGILILMRWLSEILSHVRLSAEAGACIDVLQPFTSTNKSSYQ